MTGAIDPSESGGMFSPIYPTSIQPNFSPGAINPAITQVQIVPAAPPSRLPFGFRSPPRDPGSAQQDPNKDPITETGPGFVPFRVVIPPVDVGPGSYGPAGTQKPGAYEPGGEYYQDPEIDTLKKETMQKTSQADPSFQEGLVNNETTMMAISQGNSSHVGSSSPQQPLYYQHYGGAGNNEGYLGFTETGEPIDPFFGEFAESTGSDAPGSPGGMRVS